MKISKINFKNIHSLRGEHHIDFLSGPLAESGLFAITGATGSGKSTLLDVITLALYNKVPRIGAISKSIIEGEGGIMTRNTQDCYAEVDYIVNGRTYRSHWSIERNRNDNLNDRRQEIIDVATGTIIESGKASVPAKNEEIIGLNYEQFIKAMVLSQGQFSKLLQSKRDDRNKLLEDITGAKDYRVIGAAVFKKFKIAADAVKVQDIKLGEIELIPEEDLKKLILQEEELVKQRALHKKELDVLKHEIENRKGIDKNEALLADNVKLQEELEKGLDRFKTEDKLLHYHITYVPHQALIANFEQKDKELLEITSELNKQKGFETSVLKSKSDLLDMAASVLGKQIDEQQYTSDLISFRQHVSDLKHREALAIAQAKLQEHQIKKVLLEVNSGAERIPFNGHPMTFQETIAPVVSKVMQFLVSTQINNESELLIKETQTKERSNLVNDLKVAFTHYAAEYKTKTIKESDLKISKELATGYKATLVDLEAQIKPLEVEVEKLKKAEDIRKQHKSLDEHRTALVNGDACPLCGALEHPYETFLPNYDVQAETLITKSELLTAKRDLKISTQTLIKNEQDKTAVLEKDLLELVKILQPNFKDIETLCSALKVPHVQDMEAIIALEKSVTSSTQIIDQVKKAFALQKALTNLKQITEEWLKSSEQAVAIQSSRKKLYAADDIDSKVQSLLNGWTQAHEKIKNNRDLIATLQLKSKKSTEERALFKNKLDALLVQENLENITKLKNYILSEAKAEYIRHKKQDFQLQGERLKVAKANALKEIDGFKKAIVTTEPIIKLQLKFQELESNFSTINERIGGIKITLESNGKAKEKQDFLQTMLNDLKKEEALWKTMNSLIGDANGKRFSNFVQDLTLEQLIGYTNLRLKDLSDRYRVDIPTADEADKNDSLKVFDSYQGDARRSIHTLSGGETFIVSLAMAFALSDLAAKNVKIESIFIDEGFGTLDPDTLNQAITILEKMQNEGDKSIGVISHVEALKERISTQIRIEKTGAGYSKIEIV